MLELPGDSPSREPRVLCDAACGEFRQRVSRGHSHRDDEQLRLFHNDSKEKRASTVTGARRRTSDAIHVGEGELSSPDQRRRTQSNCAQSSPVEITSSAYPDAEGCCIQTEVDLGDDMYAEFMYTPSGEPEPGQLWIHPDGVVIDEVDLIGVSIWR